MATTIKTKNSTTAATAPTGLVQGELAVNITDKKLYVGDAVGNSIQIAGQGATNAAGGSNTQVQYNSSGALAGSSNMTFDGTTLTVNGLATTGTVTVGDASGDALTINSSAVSIPNGLNFDSNTFVIDATNNRVGVGTASPNAPIHSVLSGSGVSVNVAATGQAGLQMTSGTATNPYMNWYSSGTILEASLFAVAGSGAFAIGTGASGAERMRIDSAGRVCIATQTAESNLTVYGTSTAPSATTLSSGTLNIKGSSTLRLLIGTDPSSPYGAWLQTTDGAGAGYPISLNPLGGNVGIGTSSPAAILSTSKSSSTQATGLLLRNPDGTNGSSISIDFETSSGTSGSEASMAGRISGLRVSSGTSGALTFSTTNAGTLAEKMRLDSSGNLGLGVTPSAWSGFTAMQFGGQAYVAGTSLGIGMTSNAYRDGGGFKYIATSGAALYAQASGNSHAWYTAPSGTAGNAITFTQAMTLDASGNLGIGTTSPSGRLHVLGSGGTRTITADTTGYAASLSRSTGGDFYVGINDSAGTAFGSTAYSRAIWGDSAYPMVFGTNSTERMRIDSSGNLLVGCTAAPSSSVSGVQWSNPTVVQSKISTAPNTGAYTALAFYNGNGQVGRIDTSGTSTAYVTSSDYRLKENVAPMTGALNKIALIKPVTYKWKTDGADGQGFIAHELAEVFPDAVFGEKDAIDSDGEPKYQGIDTSFLVATLTAAIQELNAKVTSLEVQLAK